jgi:plasmid stabilization system protein ParE
MQIRWSPEAAGDLESIVDYIANESPAAALRVAQSIYDRRRDIGVIPIPGQDGPSPRYTRTTPHAASVLHR